MGSRGTAWPLDSLQLKGVVLLPQVAEQGLDTLDWLWQSRRVPGVAFLAVAGGTAEEIMAAGTSPLAMPALFLYHQFKSIHATDNSVMTVYRWQSIRHLVLLLVDLMSLVPSAFWRDYLARQHGSLGRDPGLHPSLAGVGGRAW